MHSFRVLFRPTYILTLFNRMLETRSATVTCQKSTWSRKSVVSFSSRVESFWLQVVDLKSTWGQFRAKSGRFGTPKWLPRLIFTRYRMCNFRIVLV